MANTKMLSKLVEPYIRNNLQKEMGCNFYDKDKKLILITGGTHKFDIVSLDKSIIGDIKSSQIRKNGKVGAGTIKSAFFDIYMLTLIKAKKKIMVFTDTEFYNLFKRRSVGKIPPDIEIILIELSDDIKINTKRVHDAATKEIGKREYTKI